MFVELVLPAGPPVDRDEVEDAVVEKLGFVCTGAGSGLGVVNLDFEVDSTRPDDVVARLRSVLAPLGIAGARANIEGHGSTDF